jgi:hypothetical protein
MLPEGISNIEHGISNDEVFPPLPDSINIRHSLFDIRYSLFVAAWSQSVRILAKQLSFSSLANIFKALILYQIWVLDRDYKCIQKAEREKLQTSRLPSAEDIRCPVKHQLIDEDASFP